MANNMFDAEIVYNAHAKLQEYNLVLCESDNSNNKDVLIAFSDDKAQRFTVNNSKVDLLQIDGYDAVLAYLRLHRIILFDPHQDFWLQDKVFIFKCDLKDGVYDIRKYPQLQKAYEILKEFDLNSKTVEVELEKDKKITVRYYHSLCNYKLKLSARKDKEVYKYFKSLMEKQTTDTAKVYLDKDDPNSTIEVQNTSSVMISKNEFMNIANMFDHSGLKELAQIIEKDILEFPIGRVSINGKTYLVSVDLSNNSSLYTHVRFKNGFCMIAADNELFGYHLDVCRKVMFYLSEFAEDLDNTYLYTVSKDKLLKLHIYEAPNHIKDIDEDQILFVDYTANKFLCLEGDDTTQDSCRKIIENKDSVILLAQSGAYVFDVDGLYPIQAIDPQDYEYLLKEW